MTRFFRMAQIPGRWTSPAGRLRDFFPWPRLCLYGLLALGLLLLGKAFLRLRESASIERDAAGMQTYSGRMTPSGLRRRLVETGSGEREATAILREVLRAEGRSRAREYPGDGYEIVRSTGDEFLHLTVVRGLKKIVILPSRGGGFSAAISSIPTSTERGICRGSVHGNLWSSMQRGGTPAALIQEFTDIFQWSVDFLTETQEGDRFSMIWTVQRGPDGRVWGRGIEAGIYEGRVAGRNVGIRFDDGYFDENGLSLQRMFLKAPLNYRRISSFFSSSRFHPILRNSRPHYGIDYSAPYGTPVSAVGNGVVTRLGYHGGIGNRVEIRHNSSFTTIYGHLKSFAAGLRPGSRVRQGQTIGAVGATGLATGPHLHFQISQNGKWINFLRIKTPRERSVPADKRSEFSSLLGREIKELDFPRWNNVK
jgi:murein DD-endopeptidase MepM/ murein hydrolase activator NlpD